MRGEFPHLKRLRNRNPSSPFRRVLPYFRPLSQSPVPSSTPLPPLRCFWCASLFCLPVDDSGSRHCLCGDRPQSSPSRRDGSTGGSLFCKSGRGRTRSEGGGHFTPLLEPGMEDLTNAPHLTFYVNFPNCVTDRVPFLKMKILWKSEF